MVMNFGFKICFHPFGKISSQIATKDPLDNYQNENKLQILIMAK